ncbi:uncharacterized protein LOC131805046 [Musca domestica]|uniref:Uncharacterized protein LOC131805046 n=1 Tax=Musca domestica TaxID=7370 RepID=A0ABM3VEP6_MUSDO|nr:uncharacterized protein LOC131805046 [Musca domestica]
MRGTRIKPDLYVLPVRLCKNCGRLGHIAIRCRSTKCCLDCGKLIICPNQCKEQKCNDCLTTTKCKEQCDTLKCILCNGIDHNATEEGKCERWRSEKQIKSLMTLSYLSRKEVLQTYPESHNYYNILADGNYNSQFPPMSKSSNQNIRNFNEEINRRITKIKYSKIAAPRTIINHPVASAINITPSIPVYEHSSFSKVSELEKTMSIFTKQMSQLLSIDESQNNTSICNYNIVSKNNYGGVAILLKNNIKFKKIQFEIPLDIIICQIINMSNNITIASIYFPHSIRASEIKYELEKLLCFLESRTDVLICGDFNARHSCYGDSFDSHRGNIVKSFFDSSNFYTPYNGNFTFKKRSTDTTGSVLDLSFTNTTLTTSWKVQPFTIGGSHHYPIVINIGISNITNQRFLAKKKLLKSVNNANINPRFDDIHATFKDEIKKIYIYFKK